MQDSLSVNSLPLVTKSSFNLIPIGGNINIMLQSCDRSKFLQSFLIMLISTQF